MCWPQCMLGVVGGARLPPAVKLLVICWRRRIAARSQSVRGILGSHGLQEPAARCPAQRSLGHLGLSGPRDGVLSDPVPPHAVRPVPSRMAAISRAPAGRGQVRHRRSVPGQPQRGPVFASCVGRDLYKPLPIAPYRRVQPALLQGTSDRMRGHS